MNKPRTMPASERGAILIMYAFMLAVILGIAGFALDLGLVYFRKAQLQAAADAIALAAAKSLNGTPAGVNAAGTAARATAEGTQFGTEGVLGWQDGVLRFSASPDAPPNEWLDSGSIDAAAARTALYARVDMGAMGEEVRVIEPLFMRALGVTRGFDVAPVAVAGPTALSITPLAVCALNSQASTTRAAGSIQERVTYGFRRGVTYNLLKINPKPGATRGAYFLVDPLAPAGPGTAGTAGMDSDAGANALVRPFMCAGKIARTNTGGMLRVHSPASFGLAAQINTRLDKYDGSQCLRAGAPPDTNVRTYETIITNTTKTHLWQTEPPKRASATTVEGDNLPMSTVADQAPAPGQVVTAADYGILWAYGPPVNTSGANLAAADWPTLYAAGVKTSSWNGTPPYQRFAKTPEERAFEPARRERRLMRIPLLKCDDKEMPQKEAAVLAYGRFFLSAAASADEVPGEFAGLDTVEAALKTDVEIFR